MIDTLRTLFGSILLPILFSLFSGVSRGYHFVQDKWIEHRYADAASLVEPHARYFLSDTGVVFDPDTDTHVPDDCVYIEEWVDTHGHKKSVVRYEGEEIPKEWKTSPFDMHATCPWVWVGDRETEIDLTRTFNRFLVPGNRIEMDLVCHLIQVTDRSNLIYIETGTFKEVKFPGDGITITADVD
jgi:hypothetical protein